MKKIILNLIVVFMISTNVFASVSSRDDSQMVEDRINPPNVQNENIEITPEMERAYELFVGIHNRLMNLKKGIQRVTSVSCVNESGMRLVKRFLEKEFNLVIRYYNQIRPQKNFKAFVGRENFPLRKVEPFIVEIIPEEREVAKLHKLPRGNEKVFRILVIGSKQLKSVNEALLCIHSKWQDDLVILVLAPLKDSLKRERKFHNQLLSDFDLKPFADRKEQPSEIEPFYFE